MMTKTLTTSGRRAAGARRLAGFTLLEMMVVIGLVALMASMALPSIVALFNSGADAQAYNLISAQFTASRAKAVLSSTYAGVHVQLADALNETADPLRQPDALLRPELAGVCFSGMIVYDSEKRWFDLIPGMAPQRIPGNVAFGYASQEVTGTKLVNNIPVTYRLEATIGDSASSLFEGAAAENMAKFTTFSVIFNPLGAVTRFANGDPIRFNDQSPIFNDVATLDMARFGSKRLWRMTNANDPLNNYVQDRYGATAITMFDVAEYTSAGDNKKVAYLNENAQLLPLNVHTGQLYKRD
jgi:prepilin-type N-terminal cleavage/methylation domain-containing protein